MVESPSKLVAHMLLCPMHALRVMLWLGVCAGWSHAADGDKDNDVRTALAPTKAHCDNAWARDEGA